MDEPKTSVLIVQKNILYYGEIYITSKNGKKKVLTANHDKAQHWEGFWLTNRDNELSAQACINCSALFSTGINNMAVVLSNINILAVETDNGW